MELQTHFETTVSPAHMGDQGYLHQDVHLHLADPCGNLIGSPLAQMNHVPLTGQTQIQDFGLQQLPGVFPGQGPDLR